MNHEKPMFPKKSDETLLQELGAIRESLLNIVMNATNLATRLDNVTAELKAREHRHDKAGR